MEEEHYYVDCFDYSKDDWSYIQEGGEVDTRLTVKNVGDKSFVIRPPSLSENRRFTIDSNHFEVAKNLKNLTKELEDFDFGIPNYNFVVSNIHTKEGSKGQGLCLMSEYIVGRCLPLNYQICWNDDKENFYTQMDKWLTNITKHSMCKYLLAEKDSLFLTDIFRPVQFAYSCNEERIYLVDLDPFYDKILNEDGTVNKRLLIGLKTINSQRNYYLNKMNREGLNSKNWGDKSKEMLKKLLESTDFVKDAVYNSETDNIMRNLKQGLYYKKF
ncbi:MAG: hypothetical protein ACOX06_00950 [Candidatus Dojkabacteria bacterium]|jgi:hypothetical protein